MLIVVARYNEDVEWTRRFPNVLIYNKGESLNTEVPLYNEILLENVGREGHTYYKYICDNYDNLEDYTVFLQGEPFYHSPNLLLNLEYLVKNIHNMEFDFKYLSETLKDCSLEQCHFSLEPLPLKDVYEKLFEKRIDNLSFIFGAGAQYVVSKDAIQKRPREFYMKIVEMLQNKIDPIEGYVIERFHLLIFSGIYQQ
jgi:hypothetical protein